MAGVDRSSQSLVKNMTCGGVDQRTSTQATHRRSPMASFLACCAERPEKRLVSSSEVVDLTLRGVLPMHDVARHQVLRYFL